MRVYTQCTECYAVTILVNHTKPPFGFFLSLYMKPVHFARAICKKARVLLTKVPCCATIRATSMTKVYDQVIHIVIFFRSSVLRIRGKFGENPSQPSLPLQSEYPPGDTAPCVRQMRRQRIFGHERCSRFSACAKRAVCPKCILRQVRIATLFYP